MGGGQTKPALGPARVSRGKLHDSPLKKLILGTLVDSCDDDFRTKLEKIFLSKTERQLFALFLKDEYCDEMLSFWRAAEIYQSHACKFATLKNNMAKEQEELGQVKLMHPHILKVAKVIFDHFISPSAPEAVNISQKMIRIIKKQLTNGVVTTELFVEATNEVKKLLAQDKMPRFKLWIKKDGSMEKLIAVCEIDEDGCVRAHCSDGSTSVVSALAGLSNASAAAQLDGRRLSSQSSLGVIDRGSGSSLNLMNGVDYSSNLVQLGHERGSRLVGAQQGSMSGIVEHISKVDMAGMVDGEQDLEGFLGNQNTSRTPSQDNVENIFIPLPRMEEQSS